MNDHVHPIFRGILTDAARLPLASSRRFRPIVECRICRKSGETIMGGLCDECARAVYACEACGGPCTIKKPCECTR